ncbi:MAG: hypothetical protein ACOYL6_08750 [Bacteriovoracaceae bacterium]
MIKTIVFTMMALGSISTYAFCGKEYGHVWEGATRVCAEILERENNMDKVSPYATFSLVSDVAAFGPLVNKSRLCKALGYRDYVNGSADIKRGDVRRIARIRSQQIMLGEDVNYINSLWCEHQKK